MLGCGPCASALGNWGLPGPVTGVEEVGAGAGGPAVGGGASAAMARGRVSESSACWGPHPGGRAAIGAGAAEGAAPVPQSGWLACLTARAWHACGLTRSPWGGRQGRRCGPLRRFTAAVARHLAAGGVEATSLGVAAAAGTVTGAEAAAITITQMRRWTRTRVSTGKETDKVETRTMACHTSALS